MYELGKVELCSGHKGFPLGAHGQQIKDFLKAKPNLFDSGFQFPVMVLRENALLHNIERMAKYCEGRGVSLAPHAKTPMSPQLAKRQMDAGAWGITVANFAQANIFLDYGFKRIIIANEIVEKTSIREIAAQNANDGIEILFYVDSLEGYKIAREAIADIENAKLHILFEIGTQSGRAGIRDLSLITKILKKMSKDSKFVIRGVSGFEGAVPDADRKGKGIKNLRRFLQQVVSGAEIVAPFVKQGKIIISAGGSSFFDYVIDEFKKYEGDALIILRSGGYLTHDHILYEKLNPFTQSKAKDQFIPALEIWSRVLSVPEPKLAILNFGKRDVGNDLHNPLPVKRFSKKLSAFKAVVLRLNDQHAYLKISAGSLNVGDLVGCGISHPCTSFDKWKLIPLINAKYEVVDCVHTFF